MDDPGPPSPAPDTRPVVLVLDDEETVRASLGRYLEGSGYRVVCAATADEAFTGLRQTSIDALVLDVQLPGGRSGLDVLQSLRLDQRTANRPVIILTGRVLSPDEEDIIRRHRAYVFYKPHGYGELVERLRQLCATSTDARRTDPRN